MAPDGRTSDPALNALIEHLLSDDAVALERRFGTLDARESGGGTTDDRMLPASQWAPRLAAAARSLYAVAPDQPQAGPRHAVDVVLAVDSPEAHEGWRFAVAGNDVVDLTILQDPRYAAGGPLEDFLVLPPAKDLPQPPAGYAFAAGVPETGVPSVDTLVGALAAHDAAALTAAARYKQGTLPARHCNVDQSLDAGDVASRFESLAIQAYALQAVATVPDGFQPPADHLLVVVLETAPYRWTQAGLLEAGGQIVGLLTECVPYPPRAFIVPPPSASDAAIDPGRRSGVAAVDAVLDALAAKDCAALVAAIDFSEVGCVVAPSGIGSPPLCRADEAPGAPVAVLPSAQCEGGYVRRDEMDGLLDFLLPVDWRLYAVVDRGPVAPATDGFFRGQVAAVLVPAGNDAQHGALLLYLNDRGITTIQTGCGQDSPATQIGRASTDGAPNFLLAPPTTASNALPGDIQPAVDAALAGDGERLGALLSTTAGPCVVNPEPAPQRAPECPEGKPAGTSVPAIVAGGCPDEAVHFVAPGITFAPSLDPSGLGPHLIGVMEIAETPVRYAALFGYDKVLWLGFDADGRLIGSGGVCAAFDLRPRLSNATWLRGPAWGN